jgi:hypothetical protein
MDGDEDDLWLAAGIVNFEKFNDVGVDSPSPEHNSFLSDKFGHSTFKPLQWRYSN